MFFFTFCEAYTVSYICASVHSPQLVLAAIFMTAAMVLALTIYAFSTSTDFTTMGALAFIALAVFMVFGLFSFWFGATVRLIYCAFGVLLFGLYLVIDTQMLIGGHKYELNQEDYILGAIILYLDIINIFLYIL